MNRSKYALSDVQLSKSLSWLLRHGAAKEGLNLDDGGYVDVNSVLNLKQFKKYDIDDILRVVNYNDKKRFSVLYGEEDKTIKIRANQGHSIPVNENKLLTLLGKDNLPHLIYHGTYLKKLEKIKEEGLSKMNRNHIHFTSCLPGEGQIISGMRQSCDVIIAIDAIKAFEDGLQFYLSDNDVILCRGNSDGIISPIYFKEISLKQKKSP